MRGDITTGSHLKGEFELSNGKGLLRLLQRKNVSISAHNENIKGTTSGLTFFNSKTNVETEFYFDKREERNTQINLFNPDKFDYQVVFDVDEHLYERFKFQKNASEAKQFYIKNDKQNISIIFDYGTGPDGEIVVNNFHKNEDLDGSNVWRYPTDVVYKILSKIRSCFICFASNGHLRIVCRTEYARYSYVVPAYTL